MVINIFSLPLSYLNENKWTKIMAEERKVIRMDFSEEGMARRFGLNMLKESKMVKIKNGRNRKTRK